MDVPPPTAIHEEISVSLYNVETSSYDRLAIIEQRRPHWILSHVLVGNVETRTGADVARARPGDVMVHLPEVPFSETASGPGTHQWFEFELRISPQIDVFRLHPVSYVVSLSDAARYRETFDALERVWRESDAMTRNLQATALAVDLVAQVLRAWHATGSTARSEDNRPGAQRFRSVIDHMAGHLSDHLSRERLARVAGLHPGYFDRVFRATFGVPPMRMLREMRLARARQLLETTDDTLESIAVDSGLGDAAYLSRVFRARFGQAPGRHREQARAARDNYLAAKRRDSES